MTGLEPQGGEEGPVTTTVARRIKPGHEPAFEGVLAENIAAASRFPGHLGVEIFRPASTASGDYRIVYRFDTGAHLRGWLDSDERAAGLQRAEPHAAAPLHTRCLTGLETWFTLPAQPSAPPARYKMAILTWVTIFPLITLIVIVLAPLIGTWPVVAQLAITTLLTVPLMTWLVMPRVTRLLGRWLYPGPTVTSSSLSGSGQA